jgi:hypothetical protein
VPSTPFRVFPNGLLFAAALLCAELRKAQKEIAVDLRDVMIQINEIIASRALPERAEERLTSSEALYRIDLLTRTALGASGAVSLPTASRR